MMLYPCPICGEPDSAFDDGYCGKCEGEYQAENYRLQQQEIEELNQKMRTCKCEERCFDCCRHLARVCELQGKHGEADYWLNQ